MKIELSFNNGQEGFILPVNPVSIEIAEGSFNKKLKILNIGEINLIGKRGLIYLQVSSFFPNKNSHLNAGNDPLFYKEKLEKWKRSGKPIRVIITGINLNLAMAIDRFTYSVKEGSEDINYILELAEYRFLNVPRIKNEDDKKVKENGLKERVNEKEEKKIYTVKKGDCLWAIAKKTMGDGAKFKELYKANKELIDSRNKNAKKYTIYVGQKLEIPR